MLNLSAVLKRAGWKQQANVWSMRGRRYQLIEEAAPGSWDRSVSAFLSKAILRARAAARPEVEPIAVLSVKRASPLTDTRLSQFVDEVAPDQSWILVDHDGRFFPHVPSAPELEQVLAQPRALVASPTLPKAHSLFTDLNQWMLKVLLAPRIPEALLSAPRGRQIRNASTLAELAQVSLPVAARLVRNLEAEALLDHRFGDLRIARPLELLQRWKHKMGHPARLEVQAVSVRGRFDAALATSLGADRTRVRNARPPLVLGLHAACEQLGLGHVSGSVPVLWTESLSPDQLETVGLVVDADAARADVVLRTPRYPESLFRGLVTARGSPATDVIQCWLDTSNYRVRGEEQADFLWRTILRPAFEVA